MSDNGKKPRTPEPVLTWAVQLRITVPVRLARRASKMALQKWLARALVGAMKVLPPEFIVQSADKLKADIEKVYTPAIVNSEGRPYRM